MRGFLFKLVYVSVIIYASLFLMLATVPPTAGLPKAAAAGGKFTMRETGDGLRDMASSSKPSSGGALPYGGGYTWTPISWGLGNESFSAMTYDGAGLYAACHHGVWYYNPVSGDWSCTGGPQRNYVYSVLWNGSLLYAGTDEGALYYDPATGQWVDLEGPVSGYEIRSLAWGGGSLYVGTYGHGAWRYDPLSNSWEDISVGLGSYDVMGMAFSGSHIYAAFWESGYTRGVWRYDPPNGKWEDISGDIGSYHVNSLYWHAAGCLYAGTIFNGVWCYNPASGSWSDTGLPVPYDTSDFLYELKGSGDNIYACLKSGLWRYLPAPKAWERVSERHILCAACDGTGVYVGPYYGGVLYFTPSNGSWTDTWGKISHVAPAAFTTLAWDGRRLYGARGSSSVSSDGVWCYDSLSSSWKDTGGGMAEHSIGQLVCAGEDLYAGTSSGVWYLEGSSGAWECVGFKGNQISCLDWNGRYLYAMTSLGSMGTTVWILNVICQYDPLTAGWWGIYGIPSFRFRTPLYFICGGSNVYLMGSTSVGRYNPDKGMWEDIGGKGFSCLGWDGSRLYGGIRNELWRYDPESGVWTQLVGLPEDREIRKIAFQGSMLFALVRENISDSSSQAKNALYAFNEDLGYWGRVSWWGFSFTDLVCTDAAIYAATDYHGIWCYHYPVRPVITSIDPPSGWTGREVQINGSGFGFARGSSRVFFGTEEATEYLHWSDTLIKCRVPALAPGATQVTVVTSQGASNPSPFEVVTVTPLTVTRVSPASGSQLDPNLRLEIEGTGFMEYAVVMLRKGEYTLDAANVQVASSTLLSCTLSLFGVEPGVYDVVVVNPDGREALLAGGFTVNSACGAGSGAAFLPLGIALGLLSTGVLFKRRRRG